MRWFWFHERQYCAPIPDGEDRSESGVGGVALRDGGDEQLRNLQNFS